MKIKYAVLSFLCALTVTACIPKSPEEKPQGVLSDAQQRTLDKAKETEDVLKKADDERRKKLEELEGN